MYARARIDEHWELGYHEVTVLTLPLGNIHTYHIAFELQYDEEFMKHILHESMRKDIRQSGTERLYE